MNPITIARALLGLNNKIPPTRLPLDLETGQIELAECVNISIDDSGRGEVRKGSTLITGGDFHSGWSWKDQYCYVGESTDLYRLNPDWSLTGIRSGLSGARICYTWTPLGVYYANGNDRGILREAVSHVWNDGQKARKEDPRFYTGPPERIKHIELFSTMMFGAVENVLWRSVPNQYNLFRRSNSWNMVPGEIRMIKGVAGGMYISDDTKTYFAQGNDPAEWTRRTVMEVPAMEWSVMPELVNPKDIGMEGSDGWAGWVSADGLVFGSPTGEIFQPTEAWLQMPSGFKDGAAVMDGHNCIYNLHQ